MKISYAAGLLLSTLLAGPALAQSGPTQDPAKVEGGVYAVEPYHTIAIWGVSHLGFTTFFGSFAGASGTLDLTPKSPDGSTLSVSVPIDSLTTTVPKLTEDLKGPQWFDAAKYPVMTFKSTKVAVTGKDAATVTGELTLHGVTRPETFAVRFNGAGVNPLNKKFTTGFELSGRVKRSDFGMTTYLPMIGDEVDLTISAAFEKQG